MGKSYTPINKGKLEILTTLSVGQMEYKISVYYAFIQCH